MGRTHARRGGRYPVSDLKKLSGILLLIAFTAAHAAPGTIVIRGVAVIDVRDGSLRPERTVLIVGNRIAAIGRPHEVAVPDEAEIVEGSGGYLIPGLWDMHVHSIANVALDRSNDAVAAQDWHFPLFLAH